MAWMQTPAGHYLVGLSADEVVALDALLNTLKLEGDLKSAAEIIGCAARNEKKEMQ